MNPVTNRPVVSAPAERQAVLLRRLLVASWSALPALLAGSVVCCAGFALVLLCGPGPTPAGVVLMNVLVLPAFSLLIHSYRRALFGPAPRRAAGHRGWWRRCWSSFWVPTLALTLIPAGAGCLALLAWQMWIQTGQWWALGPLAVCLAATVLSTLAAVLALTLRESDPQLSTVQLWALAMSMIARQPIPAASTLVLPAAGLWACLHVSASLVLLVPAPAAFILVAAVWTSLEGQSVLAAAEQRSDNPTTVPRSQL